MPGEGKRSGFCAVIGRPNVGKSTLTNRIIGQKIAITSDRPQTTRNRIRTVYTDERGQIVFVDTPGIQKPRNRLGEYMDTAAKRSAAEADVILWLVEADEYVGPRDKDIVKQLSSVRVPVILVINKTDTKKRAEIAGIIDIYRRFLDFAEVVPVSAKTGENVDVLIEQVFKYLPEGEAFFDEDTVTDQTIRQIVAEMIREKALKNLGDEIPHGVAVTVEIMDFSETKVDIGATLICEKESHKGIIIGKGGSMIKKIGTAARRDIEELLDSRVNLDLWIKVRSNWRDSDVLMKNFGYDRKDLTDG